LACKVEILCIGNELLIGKTANTNAQWLSERITKLGGEVTRVTIVGDDIRIIGSVLREILRRRPDIAITSGGLGPTFDDKTLQAFSKAFKKPLQISRSALRLVKSKYRRILEGNTQLTPPRLKMATFPLGAKAIPNPVGTAPAVTLRQKGIRFIVLPGVPAELQSIFGQSFESLIRRLSRTQYFYETSLIVWSLLESQLAPMIGRVMEHIPGVYIKFHAKGGEGTEEGNIELHFSAKAAKLKLSRKRILKALTLMSELLGRSMPDNRHPRAGVP